MKVLFALVASIGATPVLAADWALRDSDRLLSRSEVQKLTDGMTITFYDDGQSKYSVGGAYSYTYASGESAFGRYHIEQDGTVCIAYRNGFGRCDRYVEAAPGRIVLLTQDGQRFPIRP